MELYDDLDANLNDYADKLLALPKSHAISHLEGTLTQYDAEEVYDYLINARKLGELHDFAEFKEVQRYFDRENGIGIQTYLFFYKGEFKSFAVPSKRKIRQAQKRYCTTKARITKKQCSISEMKVPSAVFI